LYDYANGHVVKKKLNAFLGYFPEDYQTKYRACNYIQPYLDRPTYEFFSHVKGKLKSSEPLHSIPMDVLKCLIVATTCLGIIRTTGASLLTKQIEK
jgi:hypothetical protein